MRILLVKTSSMGDVVHTLTAVREAKIQCPDLIIDWLVEADFADIAKLAKQQGNIHRVIPIHFRQWRKRRPFGVFFNPDIQALKKRLKSYQYDWVLDAQGLFKSAFLARLAAAPIAGFDTDSAREGLAAYCYQHRYPVAKEQHAVERLRLLFAQALDYQPLPKAPSHPPPNVPKKQIVLLHGTTWDNKCYPTDKWRQLVTALSQQGYQLLIPHQGEAGYRTAEAMSKGIDNAQILPEQSLEELRATLIDACAVVSVDTGLAHLAVYLGIPTVMLFGPTRPELTGGFGEHTANLVGKAVDTACMKRENLRTGEFSPSMAAISTQEILTTLNRLLLYTRSEK